MIFNETAQIKQSAEHFRVEELLHFEPDGEGEHLYLLIRRQNLTTAEVVRRIAKAAKVQRRNVSFSGTKDKQADVSQWFSVWLPGKTFEPSLLAAERLEVVQAIRHRKKLKRGTHKINRFGLLLTDITGHCAEIESRLEQIKQQGYANGFGRQRFGIKNSNLTRADSCDDIHQLSRSDRSFALSAMRALIFNEVLAKRLSGDAQLSLQEGDIAMFTDGATRFKIESLDDDVLQKQKEHRIVPTGPLWGIGGSEAQKNIALIEEQVAAGYPHYVKLLAQANMVTDRRPLKVYPDNMEWQWLDDTQLQLSFSLPKSAYATSLVANIVTITETK